MWEDPLNTKELNVSVVLEQPDLIFFTFHTYGYIGFFKPSLNEVYQSLPINPTRKFYVTTNMLTGDPNDLIIGEYHIDVTKIWYKD